jgi:hypothetical protein
MAYIEGANEVQPGDPVDVLRNGKPLERAVVKRIGRMGIEVEDSSGACIALDFRVTNEAIWDRGRKYLEEQAGLHEPVPILSR